jgi:hypothetical protein
MDRPSISYATRSDSTQQAEIATLANVYSFVIKSSQAKKEAAIAAGSDVCSLRFASKKRRST